METLRKATLQGRGRRISEFKVSLVYKVSSRTARGIQRNPVLKNKTKQNKKKICLNLLFQKKLKDALKFIDKKFIFLHSRK